MPKLERLYSIYQDSFKKVRISFNKENLPTKVELYYEGENGLAWYSWRTYSYPYKNEADFKEDLDSVYKIYKDQQKIEAEKKKSECSGILYDCTMADRFPCNVPDTHVHITVLFFYRL